VIQQQSFNGKELSLMDFEKTLLQWCSTCTQK